MKNPAEHEALLYAEQVVAVANTALFIVGRLREDPRVIHFATNADAGALIRFLKAQARRKHVNHAIASKVYLYTVAVALSGNAQKLSFLQNPEYGDRFGWLPRMVAFLLAEYPDTRYHNVSVHSERVLNNAVDISYNIKTNLQSIDL